MAHWVCEIWLNEETTEKLVRQLQEQAARGEDGSLKGFEVGLDESRRRWCLFKKCSYPPLIQAPELPLDSIVERVTLNGSSAGSLDKKEFPYLEGGYENHRIGGRFVVVGEHPHPLANCGGIRMQLTRNFRVAVEGGTVRAVQELFLILEGRSYSPEPLEAFAGVA